MPTERSKKYPGDLNIISLGAGVQSSMMALAFSRGEFEVKPGGSGKIDFAIFADTQNEGDGTYAWLDYLEKQLMEAGMTESMEKQARFEQNRILKDLDELKLELEEIISNDNLDEQSASE